MTPLPPHARLQARTDRAARSFTVRLAWFSLLALLALWGVLGEANRLNDFHDAHFLFAYDHHAYRSIMDFGQFPLWDPWSCGGMHNLGSPQTRFASPPFLVSLVFGPERAIPLIAFLLMVVGAEGAFRYLRLRTPSPTLAALVAPAFMLNGFMATSYALGWLQFHGFAFLPWVLYGTHRAFRGHLGGFVVAPLAFAWMVGYGGTYAPPLTVLLVFFEGLAALPLARDHRSGRALAVWALRGAVLALLVAAASWYRVGPVLDEIARGPRVMAGSPGYALDHLASMLFGWPGDDPTGDRPGRYLIGLPLLVPFVIVGMLRRETRIKGLFLAFIVLAATGYHYGAGPFTWLRELPIFDTLRYPERMLFIASLYYAELLTSGMYAALRALRRVRRRHMAPALAAVLVACPLVSHAVQVRGYRTIVSNIRYAPVPERVEQPFAMARGNRWVSNLFAYRDRGSIGCGEAWPVPMSTALRGDLTADEYLVDPSAGSVARVEWTPNRIVLAVDVEREAVVRVNQNHHPGWHSDVGQVLSDDGLLAVRLPAGQHRVELSFSPRSAIIGLATSGAFIVAACGVFWWRRRRTLDEKRALMVLTGLPVIGFAGAFLLAPSEVRAPPNLFNPDGSPALVETLPPDATRIEADFDVPVTLAAASFEPPDVHGYTRGALYFRVTGRVPRTVGLFVHAFREGQHIAGADAEVVAGTWFFAGAPRDGWLRHAVTLRTGEGLLPVIYAGLYHISGDGSRVRPVRGPTERLEADGRVRVTP